MRCTVSLKCIVNTIRVVKKSLTSPRSLLSALARGGSGSNDEGDLKLFSDTYRRLPMPLIDCAQ